MFGPGFAQKVVEEVNKIRLNPKSYSNKIRGYLSCFKGNVLRIPNQQALMTTEGATAYREAADFLMTLPKLQSLAFDKGLSSAAQDMAKELSLYQEFEQMDAIDRESIVNKYGRYEGQFGESTDFGSMTPEMVVINLLVDDGNKNRSNRKMLFKETYRKVGCGSCPHSKFKSITVLMYATDYILGGGRSGGAAQSGSHGYKTGAGNVYGNKNNTTTTTTKTTYTKVVESEEPGYVKDIRPEENIYTSGIQYRYVNNVDPNKDLICDTAKYDGPIGGNVKTTTKTTTTTFKEETYSPGTQAGNPGGVTNSNYRQRLDVSGNGATKVGGGGSILNTNVESSGWTPSLQNSEYVKARQRAEQEDLANNQYRVKIPDSKKTNVGGGGSILNTNVESSGWTPTLQRNYKPPQQEENNNYMSRINKNVKTQKVGGGGAILNTNVESSGWVTDFEKQKSPDYWKAKQEYQDNCRVEDIKIGPVTGQVGGGAIGNSNVESADWNDYSGYERRIPYYHEEKQYEAYSKEEAQPAPKKKQQGFSDMPDMSGVTKVEQFEKIVNEGGKQVKLTKLVKYMENGEIKTEITKSPV